MAINGVLALRYNIITDTVERTYVQKVDRKKNKNSLSKVARQKRLTKWVFYALWYEGVIVKTKATYKMIFEITVIIYCTDLFTHVGSLFYIATTLVLYCTIVEYQLFFYLLCHSRRLDTNLFFMFIAKRLGANNCTVCTDLFTVIQMGSLFSFEFLFYSMN